MNKYNGYNIIEYNKFHKKLIGLMFKNKTDYGILINNCRSILTFFMKFNIDVIFLDNNNNIIKKYKNVKKNKILICPKAKKVIEIPSSN